MAGSARAQSDSEPCFCQIAAQPEQFAPALSTSLLDCAGSVHIPARLRTSRTRMRSPRPSPGWGIRPFQFLSSAALPIHVAEQPPASQQLDSLEPAAAWNHRPNLTLPASSGELLLRHVSPVYTYYIGSLQVLCWTMRTGSLGLVAVSDWSASRVLASQSLAGPSA
jgi:hypothetical protein